MADSDSWQTVSRKQERRNRPTSHLQIHSCAQHHDREQDLFWPEPIDASGIEDSVIKLDNLSLRPPRKDAIKRRPVPPLRPQKTSESTEIGDKTIVSPIIPGPLQIRKPKSPIPSPPMRSVRLLVASLGNPPPYHSTRHSAGHIALKNLGNHLGLPALAKSKQFGSGHASSGADVGRSEYTLWQSGSLMNISGQGTSKAWRAFSQQHTSDNEVTALVILHDELEAPSGTVKVRRGESSPKGHNGIKSVQTTLKSAGVLNAMGERFIKIGIGIGRPLSREKDDVSAWVLGQLTGQEKNKLDAATESLAAVLEGEISRLEGA
jgi:peptidyl-tRNA hydrolase, PTH1 family